MKRSLFLLCLPAVFLLNGCYQVSPKYCQEVTVTNTEVVRSSESSHYRASFLDSDGNTFILTNEDALSALKFNSGDVQAELDAAKTTGEKIWVNYYGWRKPLLSMYPNIKSVSKQNSCL
jgi:hypothetical protein